MKKRTSGKNLIRFFFLFGEKVAEISLSPDLRTYQHGGMVLSVGQGDVGQLGLGTEYMEKMRPAAVPECVDVVSIAAGGMHSVCLTKAGTVLTFGCNDEGALGRDTSVEDSETTPGPVQLDGKAVQVTAGDSHSAALLEDGRVFAWGSFRVGITKSPGSLTKLRELRIFSERNVNLKIYRHFFIEETLLFFIKIYFLVNKN